jgi:hypothetical protein
MRIAVAAVLAASSDAVLVAHHLPERNAYLVTALAHLHAHRAKKKPGEKKHAGEKG